MSERQRRWDRATRTIQDSGEGANQRQGDGTVRDEAVSLTCLGTDVRDHNSGCRLGDSLEVQPSRGAARPGSPLAEWQRLSRTQRRWGRLGLNWRWRGKRLGADQKGAPVLVVAVSGKVYVSCCTRLEK